MTKEQAIKCMGSSKLSEGEKFIIQAQYFNYSLSNFGLKLWELMCAADDSNLEKLKLGWPYHVSALYDWRNGNLISKCEGV